MMRLPKWSMRRWLLTILTIVSVVLIGLRLRLKWEVHHALSELTKAGLPTKWQELAEFYGRIPESSNAAPLLTNAYALFVEIDHKANQKLPVVGMIPRPPIDHPWPEDIDRATSIYLDQNSKALAAILKALERPDYRYYRDFGASGYDSTALSLPSASVKLLSLACMYAAQKGERERAWQLVNAEVKLASFLQHEPSVMDQLVHLAMVQVALFDVERLLGQGDATSIELSVTRKEIGTASQHDSLARSIEGERVGYLEPIYWQSQPIVLDFDDWELGEKNPWYKSAWIHVKVMAYRMSGLGDRDLLYYLEQSRLLEDVASQSLMEVQKLADDWNNHLPNTCGESFHYWSEMGLDIYSTFLSKVVTIHGRLRATDTTLAVAQFRLKHEGKLPDSLEQLVPEYLEKVPVEPKSGKPFELIKTADGFGIGRGAPVFKVLLNGARQEPRPTGSQRN